MSRPVYLDCAATTPIDPRVREEVVFFLEREFGNAGSRTHEFGAIARKAVERARSQVARVIAARRGEVIFTSGATESNNLALQGLAPFGEQSRKTHVVSTRIEHHAVLEPLRNLEKRGFEVTLVEPNAGGWVDPDSVADAVRADTLLVSVMDVNNETGVLQPITAIAHRLARSDVYFHVDAAQGFGKHLEALRHPRIDFLSVSGHKICAPKGIGALVVRRRRRERPPLTALTYGGGQELGLRPGTLPVHLIAGLGKAAELALEEHEERHSNACAVQGRLLQGLAPLDPHVNGDPERLLPYILNLSFPGYDADSVMEAWAGLAAVSDGAACTSQSYTCSHVLSAMRLAPERQAGAVRLSWCHLTEPPDVKAMVRALRTAGP